MNKKSNITTLISAAVGLGLFALLAFALFSPGGGRPQPGEPAPDFTLTLLDGNQTSLSDLRGQTIVLNFWSSWCEPCRQEAPALQTIWETYRDKGIVLLGVSYKDAPDVSRAFVQEFGLTYPNGVDPRGRISRAYGITAVPETFIIAPQGQIAWYYIGQITAAELTQRLNQMTQP